MEKAKNIISALVEYIHYIYYIYNNCKSQGKKRKTTGVKDYAASIEYSKAHIEIFDSGLYTTNSI